MSVRKIIILGSALFIVVSGVLLMYYFTGLKKEPPQNPSKEAKRYVETSTIEYRDINSGVFASGRLASGQYVDVISEVQGKILYGDIPLKKGQVFWEGQLLFKIFDKEALYNLQAKKSRFLTSIANLLADFKIDFPDSYQTWNNFFESIDISNDLPELPSPKSRQEKVFLATRNILSDYYSIKSDETRLSKYYVRAPFDGTFLEVYLETGSVANPGTRIAKIIKTGSLELEVPLETRFAKWIEIGDSVHIRDRDRIQTWKGIIVRESGFVNENTQSLSVFVKVIPQKKQPLFKGMYLEAVFPGTMVKNGMKIPRNAVYNNNEVFVVVNNRLVKKEINILKVNEESYIFSNRSHDYLNHKNTQI